ncbi:hypothetical protein AQF52_6799 [Streptomyces venezuelae]|uniref:hypothetical protein n=1 Tax=Streptomyces gardneri TaxID=66892 RepID=UPI0006BD6B55|nr:hypothetical protein [Streptomyces gardneri]ALO12391.1 hypothetical protein AQF52_6799 [Streptomyces venezuelae]QPK49183.1 hypothetical protein H4W23_34150 [Streptomyces gardneri]WRK40686.1 hypothetical protein U0M97_34320 [Streptomyces venezuelae]CUM37008.1 hypothetical protein BN2537_2981 [Streptomyces venezuelae]
MVNDLIEEGWEVDSADLTTITPYITSKICRFGVWHLDMESPEGQQSPATDGRVTASGVARPSPVY